MENDPDLTNPGTPYISACTYIDTHTHPFYQTHGTLISKHSQRMAQKEGVSESEKNQDLY